MSWPKTGEQLVEILARELFVCRRDGMQPATSRRQRWYTPSFRKSTSIKTYREHATRLLEELERSDIIVRWKDDQ